MTDKLSKPYTGEQRADFIVKNNHDKGLRIEETNTTLYALESYEKVENGEIINISDTKEYKEEIALIEKMQKIDELTESIKVLDLKSLRAIREGGVKDEATGQTWLEYYTAEIKALREEMANL